MPQGLGVRHLVWATMAVVQLCQRVFQLSLPLLFTIAATDLGLRSADGWVLLGVYVLGWALPQVCPVDRCSINQLTLILLVVVPHTGSCSRRTAGKRKSCTRTLGGGVLVRHYRAAYLLASMDGRCSHASSYVLGVGAAVRGSAVGPQYRRITDLGKLVPHPLRPLPCCATSCHYSCPGPATCGVPDSAVCPRLWFPFHCQAPRGRGTPRYSLVAWLRQLGPNRMGLQRGRNGLPTHSCGPAVAGPAGGFA